MKYTKEQLSFLSKNRKLQRNELTERFNQTFNTNKSVTAINSLCEKYKFLTGRTGQFVKGQDSWNKGIRGYLSTNKTSFKKGNMPHNHKPIGSERLDKEGYIYRKVADTRNKKNDWKMVHILLWEKYNGAVPLNHAVIFKDNNKNNISIENLELVSRSELMRRNTIHRYPPELKEVIRLNNKLRKALNE